MVHRAPGRAAAIAVTVVLLPTLLVSWSFRASEQAEVEQRLERAAEDVATTVDQELGRLADLAADLAISLSLVDRLDAGAYAALLDSYDLERRFPALNGVSFIDRVPRDGVEEVLRRRAPGGPDLVLREDGGEDMVRPVTMSYPLERNRAVLGVDLTSRPESRVAHDGAIRTGGPVLSDLTQIVQFRAGEPGAVLHLPVPGVGAAGATVGLVFSVRDLLADLDPLPADVEVRLLDPGSSVFPDPVVLPAAAPAGDRTAQVAGVAPGQDWVVEVAATASFVQPLPRRGSTLLAFGGVVVALLVGLLASSLAGRERLATALVAERTAQLTEANRELAAANRELAVANVRLEEADRNKDDFLAAVSHELRTPLTVIGGFVESLRRLQPTGSDLASMLDPIDRNVRRLDVLVGDLLTLVSLDAGAVAVLPEAVHLAEVLPDAPRELAGLPPERVRVRVDGDPVVCVDRGHLERILTNLLVNADRHGRPPIDLHARARDEHLVELCVRDHGPGIDEDQLEVVFERFRRAPGKPAVTGTGLGLAIVRELAVLAGGGIAYERADPGARFTLWLPAVPAPSAASPGHGPGPA